MHLAVFWRGARQGNQKKWALCTGGVNQTPMAQYGAAALVSPAPAPAYTSPTPNKSQDPKRLGCFWEKVVAAAEPPVSLVWPVSELPLVLGSSQPIPFLLLPLDLEALPEVRSVGEARDILLSYD